MFASSPSPSPPTFDIPVSMTRRSALVFSMVMVSFLISEYFQIELERWATLKSGN